MAAYSQDLRDRVLSALARGEGATALAQRLDVSVRWVYHVKDRYEQSGERGARRLGGYRRLRLAACEARIRGWLAEQVDLTLAALSARLAQHGVSIKTTALWRQLNKWGLTYQKNAARRRAVARRGAGRAPRLAGQPAHAGGEQAGVAG
jgi:transposase